MGGFGSFKERDVVGVGSCIGAGVAVGNAGVDESADWTLLIRVCASKSKMEAQRVGTSCGRAEHLALRKIRYSSSRTSMHEKVGTPMNSVEQIS